MIMLNPNVFIIYHFSTHGLLQENSSILLFQDKLQEFLGRSDLDKHLDADEAIVFGASLHAANLSDGIKLNRKLGMIDGSNYGSVIEMFIVSPTLAKQVHMFSCANCSKPCTIFHVVCTIILD